MKYTSCMQCGKMVATKFTSLIDHKRICHDCKKSNQNILRTWEVK